MSVVLITLSINFKSTLLLFFLGYFLDQSIGFHAARGYAQQQKNHGHDIVCSQPLVEIPSDKVTDGWGRQHNERDCRSQGNLAIPSLAFIGF